VQCIAKLGAIIGHCTFTGDPDETPSDCDEYPFASTEQPAANR